MVTTDPHGTPRRRRLEHFIRNIDCAIYVLAIVGGIIALWMPPHTVQRAFADAPWLNGSWGWLLIVAGVFGGTGRAVQLWFLETPGAVASAAGCAIYAVVLWGSMTTLTTGVAAAVATIASASLLRRYLELLVFTNDPGAVTVRVFLTRHLRARRASGIVQH